MPDDLSLLRSSLNGPVLVTGHTGFKGTWLTLLLESLGIEVHGISLPPEKDSLYAMLDRENKILESFLDIRNYEAVEKFLARKNYPAIIHMAAQPLVIESYKTPRQTFETNVIGTANVFDAASKIKSTKAVITITTDKVYRNNNLGQRFKEYDPLGGKDPYSASKVGTEAVVSAWQQISKIEGGPKYVSVRAGNVIGGGDLAQNRLIPDLIRGLSTGSIIKVRNPNSTRPWQHVLDPLIGYLMCLQSVLSGKVIENVNFGPLEPSLRVDDVVKIVSKTWGGQTQIKLEEPSNLGYEATRLELDSTFAANELGWKPLWTQEEAIIQTINWWKKVKLQKNNPLEVTLDEIKFAILKHKSHEN